MALPAESGSPSLFATRMSASIPVSGGAAFVARPTTSSARRPDRKGQRGNALPEQSIYRRCQFARDVER